MKRLLLAVALLAAWGAVNAGLAFYENTGAFRHLPEPETYVMLLAAIGLIGTMVLRRR